MKLKKSNLSNIFFLLVLVLVLIPHTRKPIQVFVQRTLAMSPSILPEEERSYLRFEKWEAKNIQNNSIESINLRDKVTLISFWATWCPPCIAEMPSLEKLFLDYGHTVNFYLVSQEPIEIVKRFNNKKQYQLPFYIATSTIPSQLQSNVLPTTYVVSKNGEIIVFKSGAANWNSNKVRALLDELLKEELK